jgi:pyruvate ferredoxin oxidoreductase delta subunit
MKEIKKSWKNIPIGGNILEAGNSKNYITGTWRTFIPRLDKEKCVNCFQCWMFCPDNSISIVENKMVGFDYDHCKGCGMCVSVCPTKAITMEKEEK